MATKKPLKAAKPAANKKPQPEKKQAQKKVAVSVKTQPKAKAPIKKVAAKVAKTVKPVGKKPAKAVIKKVAKPVAKKPVPKVASKGAKASKPAAKPAVLKKVVVLKKVAAKKAISKTKVPVKKSVDSKKEVKNAAPAKKAVVVSEKKTVKIAPTEPVLKKVDAKKAAVKTVEIKPETVKTAPAPKAVAPVKKAEPKPAKPVVIPKTSTDKKVEYEPDFMKSVLDTPVPVSQGPTMRYSDAELQEFRDLINKKLDAAKKELAYLQGLITRRDEMGGDETDNRYMTMEDGGMSMEREQLSQMASRQITFIDHLEKAIMRIENKTYGICRVTGKLIDKARLRAVPHATLSMEAKLGIVK